MKMENLLPVIYVQLVHILKVMAQDIINALLVHIQDKDQVPVMHVQLAHIQ